MQNKAKIKVILLVASTFAVMANSTIAPSLPIISNAFSHVKNYELLVKLIITLPGLMIALTSPFIGWLLDVFGRKRLLIISLIIYGIAGTTGLYLNSLVALLAGRALLGMAVAGVMTGCTTLLGDYFEGDERKKLMGLQAAFMAFGGTVFAFSGGMLADVNWRFPFLIYNAAILITPFAIWWLFEPAPHKTNEDTTTNKKVSKAKVAFIYIMGFIGMVVFFMVPTQLPFYLISIGKTGASLAGISIAVLMTFTGISSLNYRNVKSRLSHTAIFAFSLLMLGAGYLIISQSGSIGVIIGGLIVAGLGAGLLMPNANLWIIDIAPQALRGRLVGGLTMSIFFGQFMSPIILAPIINVVNLSGAFMVVSISLVGLSVLLFAFKYRLDK